MNSWRILTIGLLTLSIGICSIQAVVLVAFTGHLEHTSWSNLDNAAVGIWTWLLTSIAALCGFISTFNQRRTLLVAAVVFSVLSVCSSLIGASLSGVMASSLQSTKQTSVDNYCYRFVNGIQYHFAKDCAIWTTLEWTLMSLHLANILLHLFFIREAAWMLIHHKIPTGFVYAEVARKRP